MEIVRDIVIDRPPEEVFAFVADARNDPRWCPKVRSVTQVAGDGPGPGARYDVVHRPVPFLPARRMEHACVGWQPPHRIEWREEDGSDLLRVTYELADLGGRTRFAQRDDARLGAPRLLHPLMRRGIGHDIAGQLRRLKGLLENPPGQPAEGGASGAPPSSVNAGGS